MIRVCPFKLVTLTKILFTRVPFFFTVNIKIQQYCLEALPVRGECASPARPAFGVLRVSRVARVSRASRARPERCCGNRELAPAVRGEVDSRANHAIRLASNDGVLRATARVCFKGLLEDISVLDNMFCILKFCRAQDLHTLRQRSPQQEVLRARVVRSVRENLVGPQG